MTPSILWTLSLSFKLAWGSSHEVAASELFHSTSTKMIFLTILTFVGAATCAHYEIDYETIQRKMCYDSPDFCGSASVLPSEIWSTTTNKPVLSLNGSTLNDWIHQTPEPWLRRHENTTCVFTLVRPGARLFNTVQNCSLYMAESTSAPFIVQHSPECGGDSEKPKITSECSYWKGSYRRPTFELVNGHLVMDCFVSRLIFKNGTSFDCEARTIRADDLAYIDGEKVHVDESAFPHEPSVKGITSLERCVLWLAMVACILLLVVTIILGLQVKEMKSQLQEQGRYRYNSTQSEKVLTSSFAHETFPMN